MTILEDRDRRIQIRDRVIRPRKRDGVKAYEFITKSLTNRSWSLPSSRSSFTTTPPSQRVSARTKTPNSKRTVTKGRPAKSTTSLKRYHKSWFGPFMRQRGEKDPSSTKLEIDEFIEKLIESRIIHMLRNEKNSRDSDGVGRCSTDQLADALVTLKDYYVEETPLENDTKNGLSLGFTNLSISRPRKPTKAEIFTQRSYKWMAAIDALREQTGSTRKCITNWEQAKDKLSTVMTFSSQQVRPTESDSIVSANIHQFTKRLHLTKMGHQIENPGFSPSLRATYKKASLAASLSRAADNEADRFLGSRLKEAYQKRDELDPSQILVKKLLEKQLEEEARERAAKLMRPLDAGEQEMVHSALDSIAPGSEVIAQEGADSIQRRSFQTLRPGSWLNDEVIHYFYVMLAKRDVQMCSDGKRERRSHFFKSFFITKLLNEGDANKDGEYEYRNVRRWSKKVPGKDLFALDKIFFPINVGSMHWVCAVVYMQERRIQFYDSLGDGGMSYLRHIFQYLQDEHQDKKKEPLPNLEEWRLVACTDDTPRQKNGFDCGVFTCMFADFLSKDCPLVFDQSHVTQCRERIALSILKGQAIM